MEFKTKYNTINKENINEMVIAFYTKILSEKSSIRNVFVTKLGDDINSDVWQEHIRILTNFWAMVALQDPEYQGNPLRAHFSFDLTREMFGEWLVMFFELIDSLYAPEQAMVFKSRAEDIASNFMRMLQL